MTTPAGWSTTRWHLQLADAVHDLFAHGAQGTRQGLVEHLRISFGMVDAEDVNAALSLLPPEAREAFR